MAEPVSLPPGSDSPPDQAREPFTEEDVELVAQVLWRACWPDGEAPRTPTPTCQADARLVLGVLAEAGRLLPAGTKVDVEHGVRQRGLPGVTVHLSEASARRNAFEWCDELVRRTTWTGPWEVVE
jgi:hypothetical protein